MLTEQNNEHTQALQTEITELKSKFYDKQSALDERIEFLTDNVNQLNGFIQAVCEVTNVEEDKRTNLQEIYNHIVTLSPAQEDSAPK